MYGLCNARVCDLYLMESKCVIRQKQWWEAAYIYARDDIILDYPNQKTARLSHNNPYLVDADGTIGRHWLTSGKAPPERPSADVFNSTHIALVQTAILPSIYVSVYLPGTY